MNNASLSTVSQPWWIVLILFTIFLLLMLGAQAWTYNLEKRIKKMIEEIESDAEKKAFLDYATRIRLIDVHSGVLLDFVDSKLKYKPASIPLAVNLEQEYLALFPAIFPSTYKFKIMATSLNLKTRVYNDMCIDIFDYNKFDFLKIKPYHLYIKDIYYFTNDGSKHHFSKMSDDIRECEKIRLNFRFTHHTIGDLYGGADGKSDSIYNIHTRCVLYFIKNNQLENLLLSDESYEILRDLIPQKDILNLMIIDKPRY
jgi:hypothetical protein